MRKKKSKNEKTMLEALRTMSRHVTQVTLPPQDASDADTSLLVLALGIVVSLCDSPASLLAMLTAKSPAEDPRDIGKVDMPTRKCLLELLLDHLSFEGQIAATCVGPLGVNVGLRSKEPNVLASPSLDLLGIAARLLELCTGPAEAQALSDAMQEVCTEEEMTTLASPFVRILQFLWVFVSSFDDQSVADQANVTIVTHQAATNVLADWIKTLAALTQHSQVWCNGILSAKSGLETVLRIVSALAQESGLRWQVPPYSSSSIGAPSGSSVLDQGENVLPIKAGPLREMVDGSSSAASRITSQDLLCYCLALVDHLVGEGAAAARVAALQIDPGCRRRECVVSDCSPHEGVQSALVLLYKLFLTHYHLSLPRATSAGELQASPIAVPDDVAQSDSALLAGCAAHTIAVCLRSCPQSLELLEACTPNPAQALGDCLTNFSAVSHAYKSMLNIGSGSSAQTPHSSRLSEGGREDVDVDEDVEELARLMLELAGGGGRAAAGRV